MSIKFACPGCGKPYELDEGLAGKKAKCKQCDQVMRIPEAGVVAEESAVGSGAIRFRCDGCGKSYSTPSHLAGKKIVCKGCGQSVKIPGDPVAAATNPKPKPTLRIEPGDPPPVDIFDLEESPVPAKKGPAGDGILADEAPRPARSKPDTGDDEPLPPRAFYEPMTAEKKKKLEKRVKKIEKSKTSYAGAAYGVSFGTVLAISLFTWRIYRTVNKIGRLANSVNSVATAPADMSPQAMAAETDQEIAEQIRQPGTAEARDWLDADKHPNHAVMEMPAEKARSLVAGFYERGAVKVYILDPTPLGNTVLTAQIAVKLPSDPAQRKACLEWETQALQGEEPTSDFGQKYLMLMTD